MKKTKETNEIVKTVRLNLKLKQCDKNNNSVEPKVINKILENLQKQTRDIKNKTIQYCWEYYIISDDNNNLNHEELKVINIQPYKKLTGYIYNKLKNSNDLYSGNCSQTIISAHDEFKNAEYEIKNGKKSIMNYRDNQPLDICKENIRFEYINNNEIYVCLRLLKKPAIVKNNFSNSEIRFKIVNPDKSSLTIIERCIDKIYKISASKLLYDKKKKKWALNLAYSFTPQKAHDLDENKILGVDLGVVYPICASVYGDLDYFKIPGGEIEKFRKTVQTRKRSLQKQGPFCGEGRIGHGIKTRNKPVYDIEDKIARFRDTTNHKYSRELIKYAVKNNCGVIQMEDLTGITSNANRFLKNWSYYDLQTKIKYKAEEAGIKVINISPEYTSQRCSRCGYIHRDNRKVQSVFICLNCGFKANADYNASQNIGIKDIDKIITKDYNEDK